MFGLMDRYTRDIGKMEKQMAEADLFILMAMYKKVTGSMTKLKVTGHMCIVMDRDTKVYGKMTNNMVKEKNNGLTKQDLRVNT